VSSPLSTTSEFSGFLRPQEAAPFFEEARRTSVVQQLARQVPVGINGNEVPVKLGKLTAAWVAEAGRKPSSKGALGMFTFRAHKIAAIAVVSAEVVRANPGNYMDTIRPDIGEAMGLAFDAAAFWGTNSPFGTAEYLGAATKAVTLGTATAANGGVHADLNEAIRLVVTDIGADGTRKRLTGWALDDISEPIFNGSHDTTGRPLYIESPYEGSAPPVRQGSLIGRPARMTSGIANTPDADPDTDDQVLGFGGDWSQAVWGQIGGITYDVSTQASVTIDGELVSLWENNLLAIRAETEFAFKLKPGIQTSGPNAGKPGTPADEGGALESFVKLMAPGA
jgi:HK97 family phage major capsid protein